MPLSEIKHGKLRQRELDLSVSRGAEYIGRRVGVGGCRLEGLSSDFTMVDFRTLFFHL